MDSPSPNASSFVDKGCASFDMNAASISNSVIPKLFKQRPHFEKKSGLRVQATRNNTYNIKLNTLTPSLTGILNVLVTKVDPNFQNN